MVLLKCSLISRFNDYYFLKSSGEDKMFAAVGTAECINYQGKDTGRVIVNAQESVFQH